MTDKFCDICQNIGFVSLNVPVRHKAFGMAQYCICRKGDEQATDLDRMLFWQSFAQRTTPKQFEQHFAPRGKVVEGVAA